MDGQDKRPVQSPGGEVCRMCGVPYPNRNPSAKMRRNHRKNCVKRPSAAGNGRTAKDEEPSVEEQRKKEVEESSERDGERGHGIEQIGGNGEMGFVDSGGNTANLKEESSLRDGNVGRDGVDSAPLVEACEETPDVVYHQGPEDNMIANNTYLAKFAENTRDLCMPTPAVHCDGSVTNSSTTELDLLNIVNHPNVSLPIDNAINTGPVIGHVAADTASTAKGLDSSVSREEALQTDLASQLSENDILVRLKGQANEIKNLNDSPAATRATLRQVSVHNTGSCHNSCPVNQNTAALYDSSNAENEKICCQDDNVLYMISLEPNMVNLDSSDAENWLNRTADENSSLQDKIGSLPEINEPNRDCNSVNGRKSPSSMESEYKSAENLSEKREDNPTCTIASGSHIGVNNVGCGAFYNANYTTETAGMNITENNFAQAGTTCNGIKVVGDHKVGPMELTAGDSNDIPFKVDNIVDIEVPSGRTGGNHENNVLGLSSQDLVDTESSVKYSVAVDDSKNDNFLEANAFAYHRQNSLEEHVQESSVGNKSDHSINEVDYNGNSIQEAPSKEYETKHSTVDSHGTSMVETESSGKKCGGADDSKSDGIFEVNTSAPRHNSPDEHIRSESKSDFWGAKVDLITVSDQKRMSDTFKEKWSSVSDKDKLGENSADQNDTITSPLIADEIHPEQSTEIQAHGMKRNGEVAEKADTWNSGKNHVTLKILLAEANLESKQNSKKNSTDRETTPSRNKSRASSKDEALPMKRRLKARQPWVPFMCCPTTS